MSEASRVFTRTPSSWDPADDTLLRHLKEQQKLGWKEISSHFINRTPNACQFRWRRLKSGNLKSLSGSAISTQASTPPTSQAISATPSINKNLNSLNNNSNSNMSSVASSPNIVNKMNTYSMSDQSSPMMSPSSHNNSYLNLSVHNNASNHSASNLSLGLKNGSLNGNSSTTIDAGTDNHTPSPKEETPSHHQPNNTTSGSSSYNYMEKSDVNHIYPQYQYQYPNVNYSQQPQTVNTPLNIINQTSRNSPIPIHFKPNSQLSLQQQIQQVQQQVAYSSSYYQQGQTTQSSNQFDITDPLSFQMDNQNNIPWSKDEDELLVNRRKRELSFAELSILLPSRTENEIWNRIDHLERNDDLNLTHLSRSLSSSSQLSLISEDGKKSFVGTGNSVSGLGDRYMNMNQSSSNIEKK